MDGRLVQLNTSPGGMPKLPVMQADVQPVGITGDWQLNRKYHGGPDRAVCLFSTEMYDWLRNDHGIDLPFGSVGENFTTTGIDLDTLRPGDRLQVGACTVEITKVRQPCKQLNRWHPSLLQVMTERSGWYCRVLEGATVRPGDVVRVLQRDGGQLTLSAL